MTNSFYYFLALFCKLKNDKNYINKEIKVIMIKGKVAKPI